MSSHGQKVRFQGGLNDYEYCASLHIVDSKLAASEISKRLAMIPVRSHERGDAKKTTGVYETSYWATSLAGNAGESYGEFISAFCSQFEKHAEILKEIHESGGRAELFVGLFARRCCDESIPCDVLLRLGQLKVDLRLDYYGKNPESDSHNRRQGQ